MKTNCLKINWPSLTKESHSQIIKYFDDNQSLVRKISPKSQDSDSAVHVYYDPSSSKQGFFHLYGREYTERFFSNLLKDYTINSELLDRLTIQQSKGPLIAHSDVDRTVIAFYLVEGIAQTVFYSTDKEVVPGTIFKDKMHELTEIERVTMEPGSWYLFNSKQIHSVECSSDVKRTSLALDLTLIFDNYENAVKKIGLEKVLFL